MTNDAQAVGEPVGWFNPWDDYHGYQQVAKEYEGQPGTIPLYAAPPAVAQVGPEPKEITMQDVRLVCGEGKLEARHVLNAVNVIIKRRAEMASLVPSTESAQGASTPATLALPAIAPRKCFCCKGELHLNGGNYSCDRGSSEAFHIDDLSPVSSTLQSAPVAAVTDADVERAWAAIVGSDVAPMCFQASVVRGDIRTALEAFSLSRPDRADTKK